FYRARLDGSAIERLTTSPGHHQARPDPKAKFFVDSFNSHTSPTQVRLCKADGTPARMLDTNPVYVREEYRTGKYELVRIPAPDGVELDGAIMKPANFDPKKKYPLWLRIYGGPHWPNVKDNGRERRVEDEVLAAMGFVVFRCDPRSSTDRGHLYNWACYRQLGVQELKDFETAIRWISQNSWVDPARIGISGGSYGGYMAPLAPPRPQTLPAPAAPAPPPPRRHYTSAFTPRCTLKPQRDTP